MIELVAIELLAVIVFCGVLPAALLHLLMKAFARRPFMLRKNYAGREVPLGLGFVWPLWGVGVAVLALLSRLQVFRNALGALILPNLGVFLLLIAIAALAAFAFGLIDDIGGVGTSKGFRGHLKALARGKLTTGAVKLFGIGITALVLARTLFLWGLFGLDGLISVRWLFGLLLLGGSIALCANFINLCDLRPGRASKTTILLLVIGFLFLPGAYVEVAGKYMFWQSLAQGLLSKLPLFLALLLPVLITLRSDLREQGMLGDAGANPAGFIAGVYLAMWLSGNLVGLAIFFLIMLALNLASEKFSFTQVIERNPLLSRLDRIGRIKTGDKSRKEEHTDTC